MGKKLFDYIIGNPPYQEEFTSEGNKTYAAPVYNQFMDATFEVAENCLLYTSDICPYRSTGKYVISKPRLSKCRMVCNIAWCSIQVVIICPRVYRSAIPRKAQLSDSVPQLVKYISCVPAPKTLATVLRAFSTANLASRP